MENGMRKGESDAAEDENRGRRAGGRADCCNRFDCCDQSQRRGRACPGSDRDPRKRLRFPKRPQSRRKNPKPPPNRRRAEMPPRKIRCMRARWPGLSEEEIAKLALAEEESGERRVISARRIPLTDGQAFHPPHRSLHSDVRGCARGAKCNLRPGNAEKAAQSRPFLC